MSDELWQDLVKNALLGTERQTFTPPQVDGPLGALLARLDSARPEHALLGAAAAVALYRRAGHVPPQGDQPLPAPCEPDDAARCNPRAAQRLRLMLEGQYPDLLSEWPAAVAQTGRRVPEEYLSALLSKGHAQANVCDAIVPVLGKRGKWLAAFNPDWDYVGIYTDEGISATNTKKRDGFNHMIADALDGNARRTRWKRWANSLASRASASGRSRPRRCASCGIRIAVAS